MHNFYRSTSNVPNFSIFVCLFTHLTVKMEFTGIQVMNTWGAHNFYPWFCHIRTHYNWLYGSDVWRICRDIEYESFWKCAVHFLSLSLLLCVYVRLFNVHKIKNIRNVNAFTLALITPMHIYLYAFLYPLLIYVMCVPQIAFAFMILMRKKRDRYICCLSSCVGVNEINRSTIKHL